MPSHGSSEQKSPPSSSSLSKGKSISKNPRLPSTYRVSKRAPLRPPIPSPYTSARSPKIIYLKHNTPFISALKRARKLLDLVAKREEGRDRWPHKRREERDLRKPELKATETVGSGKSEKAEREEGTAIGVGSGVVRGGTKRGREEVILKGMSRAIEKVLDLALWFEERREYKVRLRTGSVGVVDDIVETESAIMDIPTMERGAGDNEDDMDVDEAEHETEDSQGNHGDNITSAQGRKEASDPNARGTDFIPETRRRMVSFVEAGISWN